MKIQLISTIDLTTFNLLPHETQMKLSRVIHRKDAFVPRVNDFILWGDSRYLLVKFVIIDYREKKFGHEEDVVMVLGTLQK